ncbi:MAG: GNAT family N-acetyltransferase [Anaerolineae bacterium]|nr:GNAT family N-acetyltransferase [Anaerolineae bacterium]
MAEIILREVTRDNWRPLALLSRGLPPDQQRYVAHNAISMLDAYYGDGAFTQVGVYVGEQPVGYVLYGLDRETGQWWIIRVMIAHGEQGKGYGRAAMQQVIERLRATPGCDAIFISFVPENQAARALYESLGFVDTGEVEEGELVFRLALRT